MTLDIAINSIGSKLRPEFAGGISSLRNSWVYPSPTPFDTVSLPTIGVSMHEQKASVFIESATEVSNAKWLHQTIIELVQLLRLPKNWNSDNPKQIETKVVEKMLALLLTILDPDSPPPAVVPTSQGGIQVEWHQNGIDLEIEAESSGKLEFFFSGPKGDKEGTIEGNPAILLKQFIHYLKATPTP